MQHINVEIKAKCLDQERIRSILKEHQAEFRGLDHQVDTYFRVHSGRLKLREGNIENNLIHYVRENQDGPKQADITLFKTENGTGLKDILSRSIGILTVVDKHREIYFIGNVKFHLDTVDGLGTFVEIEAIGENEKADKEQLLKQCQYYLSLFGIQKEDLIAGSYSDMLLSAK